MLEEVEREVGGGDDNILEVDPVSQSQRWGEGNGSCQPIMEPEERTLIFVEILCGSVEIIAL